MMDKFFLPGTDKQLKLLLSHFDVNGKDVLVIGAGCESIAKIIKDNNANTVVIIVEDNDSLLTSRLLLANVKSISVRMMEFDNTDFASQKFDLVYAQASISNSKRNKILREIKRILKPDGFLCVGESVSLKKSIPQFVKDIWKFSGIVPLGVDEAEKFYRENNFKVFNEFDLSSTLKEFYQSGKEFLKGGTELLTDKEKSYYKKVLNQISHESNVYLKLGGYEYIGFRMFLLKKGKE
jgi:ubiquinone/menaquinone biosynthesis C-methylase UbiE